MSPSSFLLFCLFTSLFFCSFLPYISEPLLILFSSLSVSAISSFSLGTHSSVVHFFFVNKFCSFILLCVCDHNLVFLKTGALLLFFKKLADDIFSLFLDDLHSTSKAHRMVHPYRGGTQQGGGMARLVFKWNTWL